MVAAGDDVLAMAFQSTSIREGSMNAGVIVGHALESQFQSTSIREGSMNVIAPPRDRSFCRFNPHRSAKDR